MKYGAALGANRLGHTVSMAVPVMGVREMVM